MSTALEKRAAGIIDDLLALAEGDRLATAERVCAGDPRLMQRVQSLLAALPLMEGFMSDVAAGATVEALVIERPGTMIGRYKLLQQIGEGGFGVVFMAQQETPVRRMVALKIIKLGMDTREVVARFEAERQALAMMDHPNIAKVLDAGATDTGRPYFVMELVRGSPLTDYCDKRRLVTAERVALLAQVCRAVQHAHSKGIIHRDLKPSNVLVTVADDKPIPKVIDFGIAKATQAKLTDRTLFTVFRQMIGTPQYMSPEQADSDGMDVDTRTDVYSLGVMLYELLVGTTPFDARSLRSAAYEEMRRILRDVEPPRPSTRLQTMAGELVTAVATARGTEPKRLGQIVHGELDWIVMKALEKDRTRRYETAAAMADDLGRYLGGEAVLAGPVSGTYRLKKTLGRYKTAVAVGSAIAAVLLLGITGTTVGLAYAIRQKATAVKLERQAVAREQELERQKTLVETEKKNALAQRAEARATLDFFTNDILAKASPNNTRDDKISQVLVDALITPAIKTVDQRFKDQPLVRASVQETLVMTLFDLGRADLALPQAKAAWDTRRATLGDADPSTIEAMTNYGVALMNLGRYPEAADVFKQAWDRSSRVLGDDDSDTISAMDNYGIVLNNAGRYAEAVEVLKRGSDRFSRVLGDDNRLTLSAMESYGMALRNLGRYAESADVLKQAWDRSRRLLGDDHPDTIGAMSNYGSTLQCRGRYSEAADVFRQAWDRSKRVLGDDALTTTTAMGKYGDALTDLGQYAKAVDVDKQVCDRYLQALGDDNPYTMGAMRDYGCALSGLGRFADAAGVDKEVWDRSRKGLGENHPDTLLAMENYGSDLLDLHKYAQAEPLLRRSAEALGSIQPDNPNRGTFLYNLGRSLAGQEKWPNAETAALENLAWSKTHPASDNLPGSVTDSLQLLNQCLAAQNKPAEPATMPTTTPLISRP